MPLRRPVHSTDQRQGGAIVADVREMVRTYGSVLNNLGESTGEYYFLFDFSTRIVLFSANVCRRLALRANADNTCALRDLRAAVHPQDQAMAAIEYTQLCRGHKRTFDAEYRLRAQDGGYVRLRVCGQVEKDAGGVSQRAVGRLTPCTVVRTRQPGRGFDLADLKRDAEMFLHQQTPACLLLVGVDSLKSINLKFGRNYGDELLARVSRLLEEAVYARHRVYRTVGDCFALILPGDEPQAATVYRYVQCRLDDSCTLSAGCVPLLTYRIPDADTLYQYAEVAMGSAKARGKNQIVVFSSEDYEKELRALELKDELAAAVQKDFEGFSLVYQPQVLTDGFRLYGAEALLRYHSARRGNISPVEFIPVLEQSGLICPVGLWVLRTALAQCRRWRQRCPDFHIGVNVSFAQLYREGIAADVLQALSESGLPGSALTLEITESLELSESPKINELFLQWKAEGIEISVDDFGTGYSSLGRLKELEVDEIKIDASFINNIQSSAYNYRLLSNMIELSDSSRIRVCCEGVETEEELAVLQELRPTLLQGYLFARPIPAWELEAGFLDPDSTAFTNHSRSLPAAPGAGAVWDESRIASTILDAENDIYYVSDPETYELYYLNPAGQRLFGVRDYQGRKCYRVLQGRSSPCPHCTNSRLRSDQFLIWDFFNEYCQRHFLLRDRAIEFDGRRARLEIASDITKSENVSQGTQERLAFARKVVEYTAILSADAPYAKSVDRVLASVGEYYRADRAYLFEPNPGAPDHWSNSFEWCADNVSSQIDNLQSVSPRALQRWMDMFARDQSVYILNLDILREEHPEEWQVLSDQGIARLIAVPLRSDGRTVGFIGVDNPRYSIRDDSQIRVLAHFLLNRIHQEQSECRYRQLLCSDYFDIPSSVGLGLWSIRLDPAEPDGAEMICDDTMRALLGISGSVDARGCYQFWYSRINPGYFHYVDQAVQNMIESGRRVQLEYSWKHPERGDVMVRCTGVRASGSEGMVCLKGYHRIVDDIEQCQSVPIVYTRDIFEYNELGRSIFFHTKRLLIEGEAQQENDFPDTWVRSGLVHPNYSAEFREAFTGLRLKTTPQPLELPLRTKGGAYEWFRMTPQHLSRELPDLDTVIVQVEPIGAEHAQELEFMRMQRFYRVLLSDSIAYAEVDLDQDELKAVGGVWQMYEADYRHTGRHFLQALIRNLEDFVPEDQLAVLRGYCDPVTRQRMLANGTTSNRVYYRRRMGHEIHWVELSLYLSRDPSAVNGYALLYLRDVNAEKERELAQLEAANRDPLTSIYNRAAFEREVVASVAQSDQNPCGTLLLLDVDNFKQVNDRRGHAAGDELLRSMARLLLATFRHGDIIGRLGGDEFMVYMQGNIPRDKLEERLTAFLGELGRRTAPGMTCSIGLCVVCPGDFDYERCLKNADDAMYHSKKNGKNGFSFFEDIDKD